MRGIGSYPRGYFIYHLKCVQIPRGWYGNYQINNGYLKEISKSLKHGIKQSKLFGAK